MRKKILLSTLLMFCVLLVSAQTYYFNSYSVKEGLVQSNTTCGIQSKDGYLWLGTESGISKFDGVNFQNITKADGLVESNITALYEDRNGVIWIGHNNGGISIVRDKNIKVLTDSLSSKTISSISEDESGNIWIATLGAGVFKLESDSNLYQIKNSKNFIGKHGLGDYIFQIYTDSHNKVWFVTDVGLKSYNSEDGSFNFEKIEGMPSYQITSIIEDVDKNLWIGTYMGGVYEYSPITKKIKRYTTSEGLSSNWISFLTKGRDKEVWIGTWGGGLSKIKNGLVKTYSIDNGLNDKKIRFIFKDREENIVVGTNEHGFSIFRDEKFEIFTKNHGLNDNQIWAIEKIGYKVFLGSNQGVNVLQNGLISSVSNFQVPVRSLTNYKDKLYIGTWGEGIYVLDKNGEIKPIPAINNFMSLNVNDVEIVNNTLWIATIKGLSSYNLLTKEFKSYPGIAGKVEIDIATICNVGKGNLMLGTRKNGLVFYDGNNFEKLLTTEVSNAPTSIISNESGEKFYVGTEGGGVYIIKNGKIEKHINIRENGLISDFILSIKKQRDNLWIITNKGVSKCNLKSFDIKNYTEYDGFTPIEGKLNSTFVDKNKIFIGTVGGLVIYNPSLEIENKIYSQINLSNIKLNQNDTILSNGVELSYKSNSLRFDFDVICLTNNSNLKYQVKLEGWDEWHDVENTHINYSNLPAGEFKLLFKATNNQNFWSQPYEFNFSIKPPFWKTWWFYLLCFIVLVLAIISFIKVREKQLQKEKRILAQKVQERTEEVVQKSKQLESALHHIQASIVYAQRIQQAILPSDEMIKSVFPNSFVFFQPRDIVSGDFYWFEKKGDEVLFSAIDCTGHGVPGAFVSMVGNNLLNQLVRKHELTKPSEILDNLHAEVQRTLQQNNNSSVKDGMDLALCNYNLKTNVLQYSGAHNPLYLIRNEELIEYKADRFAIGYKGASEGKNFTNIEIEVQKGDVVYIFSDGFVDQFGGEKGRKYMSKKFKRYLVEQHKIDFNTQKENFNNEIKGWMRDEYKQIDDILVWGVKF